MEPNYNNISPPVELPQPQELDGQALPEYGTAKPAETRGSQMPSIVPVPSQQNPAVVIDHNIQSVITQPQMSVPAVTTDTTALIADDTDLIEKEWVIRAKAIVSQTKDDPHQQHREISKVKADYLKKRYNKDLKLSEN